jgi:hypothetical protein
LTFATVRHRTKVTKGPGSKAAGIAMAFKLIEAAQERWRAVNAPHPSRCVARHCFETSLFVRTGRRRQEECRLPATFNL